MIGWNARMDGFQGAVLNVKLKYLTTLNDARRKNAERYNYLLSGLDDLMIPPEADYAKHMYHVYAIRVQHRDTLMKSLADADIHCGIHYPIPVHLQDAYDFLEISNGSYPIAETCAREFISLPMYPELSRQQIEYVAESIKNFTQHDSK